MRIVALFAICFAFSSCHGYKTEMAPAPVHSDIQPYWSHRVVDNKCFMSAESLRPERSYPVFLNIIGYPKQAALQVVIFGEWALRSDNANLRFRFPEGVISADVIIGSEKFIALTDETKVGAIIGGITRRRNEHAMLQVSYSGKLIASFDITDGGREIKKLYTCIEDVSPL